MKKSVKIAVSLPHEDFKKIEKLRKELHLSRSMAVDQAILAWWKERKQHEQIDQYVSGYLKGPESTAEVESMEKAAAGAFLEEGLE